MLSQRTKSSQTSVIDHETNNALTYEKCPEMSQLMLKEKQFIRNLGAEDECFSKIADFSGFQEREIEGFSGNLDKIRRPKERKGPEYRRINSYYKSKKQYWKERNRRKKAWELSGQGLTYKQIAEKLDVSEKTVQRDIRKIRPYYNRLSKKYFRELEQQRIDDLNAELEGKTLSHRFKILSKKMVTYNFLMKQREYNRHIIKIIIDMDDQTEGFPAIRFWPKPPNTLQGTPYHFQFHIKRKGEQCHLGELRLG
jgi:predicted transcriptional regulator